MDAILDFLADNYVYFIIISGVLLVALIGLLAKEKARKKKDVSTLASAGQISKQAEELQAAEVGGSQSNENDGPLGMQDETQSVGDTLVIPDPSASQPSMDMTEQMPTMNQGMMSSQPMMNQQMPQPQMMNQGMMGGQMMGQPQMMNNGMMNSQPMMNQPMPQPQMMNQGMGQPMQPMGMMGGQMMNQGMMGGQMMGQPQMMNQQMYMDPNQMNNMNQGM